MEQLADILQYLKKHPEVTWSGAGLTALAILYFLVTKLFVSLFRKKAALPIGDTFTCKGGEQNVAQGEGAIGRQTNVFMAPLKPRVLILVAVLLGAGLAGWYWLAPKGEETHVSTTGGNAPATVVGHDATVHYNTGVAPDLIAKAAEELGEKKQIIKGFLGMLLKEQVPQDQWGSKLREIAGHYKELLTRLATVQSEDPEVQRLKQEAWQSIEADEYGRAEDLLMRS